MGDHLTKAAGDESVVVWRDGAIAARCGCWWHETPSYDGLRTGVIGQYAARDAEAGAAVLSQACDVLARAGCAAAVGPMDGSTWHSYRFIVDRGSEPPFFLEPDAPDEWPNQWTSVGFEPIATYSSSITERLDVEPPSVSRAIRRLAAAGMSFRRFDAGRAERELRQLFELSSVSFRRSFLYTPIAYDRFESQYAALLPILRPELVLVAEREETAVGFVFAFPDLLQARRSPSIDTVVIKTLAVHPSVAGTGIGGVLVALVHRQAHALGFRRAIHALMHDDNVSRGLSGRFARPFRRYALFAKRLA
jgi:GNAT superfamily N-acetyltransferase